VALTDAARSEAQRLRVLVVDDNASILRFLTVAFGGQECEVAQAGTAEQALELVRCRPFDLIVSDIKMPGLSGLDLLRAVKGRQPDTPVVLITGAPSVNSAVFGLRHGAYDYLPKPFTVKDIHELLGRVRRDRASQVAGVLPAGLGDELARRQFGVETLFRIGELALDGIDAPTFAQRVLGYTVQSLRADAGVLLLRAPDGVLTAARLGAPAVVTATDALLERAFDTIVATGGRGTTALGENGTLTAIAAAVPGLGDAGGLLCVVRASAGAPFLPDEKELLLGYARTTAVALQKILLREGVEKNLVDTIASFVNAIESKDLYLKGHSARVGVYAGEIATALGLGDADVVVHRRAGMLHDLGKLVMLDSILRKPGSLTAEEYGLIQAHTVVGGRILQPLRFLAREAMATRHHHERYDGKGYPDGLAGEAIPLTARVVTVADCFDAMTSDRPYRGARPLAVAREDIFAAAGTQLDPVIVDAFVTIPLPRLAEISRSYQSEAVGDPGEVLARCPQAAAVMAG
jgi:response regulator RpfG family c-di-GMP phosphodiesterase